MRRVQGTRNGSPSSNPRRRYHPKEPAEVTRNMSAIRAANNQTEVSVGKTLFAMGLRYRKYSSRVPGRPDIVFPTEKVAVFIDGDFWHARTLRERGARVARAVITTQNRKYWLAKFHRRIERDDEVTALLAEAGWLVIRVWESEAKADLNAAALRIAKLVRDRRASA